MKIIDNNGNIDYIHKEKDILSLVSKFNIVKKRIFKRIDYQPIKHEHQVIELILQKP